MSEKVIVMDPLQPKRIINTERQGSLKPGYTGWLRLSDSQTAAEIKQRNPHMIVRAYEDNNGGRSERPTFTMPAMPWKVDADRQIEFTNIFNNYYRYLNGSSNS